MRRTHRLACITLLLAAAGLPACGDDGGNTDDDDDDSSNDGGASEGAPDIEALSPDHGPLRGGTEVTLTGVGFVLNNAGDNNVVIGGVLSDDVTTIDDTTVIAVVPAGVAPGAVDVVLFNANGFSSRGGAFSYNPLPTVTSVDPDRGDRGGGTTVTVTGTGFQELEAGDATVTFAGAEGTEVEVVSDTELTVTTPPGAIFTLVDVGVENENGAGSATQAYGYNGRGLLIAGWNRDSAGSTLTFVDPQNGQRTPLFDIEMDGQEVGLGAMATSNGVLYGVAGHRNDDKFLLSIDLFEQRSTVIGALIPPIINPSAAGSGGSNFFCHDATTIGTTIYCAPRYNGDPIFSIDLDDAELVEVQLNSQLSSKPVIATSGTDTWSLAEICTKGCFYELRDVGDDWTPTPITTLDLDAFGSPAEMAYFDGSLYLLTREGGGKGGPAQMAIYRINPSTGVTTQIAAFEGYHHAMGATE